MQDQTPNPAFLDNSNEKISQKVNTKRQLGAEILKQNLDQVFAQTLVSSNLKRDEIGKVVAQNQYRSQIKHDKQQKSSQSAAQRPFTPQLDRRSMKLAKKLPSSKSRLIMGQKELVKVNPNPHKKSKSLNKKQIERLSQNRPSSCQKFTPEAEEQFTYKPNILNTQKSQLTQSQHIEKLMKIHQSRMSEREVLLKQKQDQELNECTFQPKIIHLPRYIVKELSQSNFSTILQPSRADFSETTKSSNFTNSLQLRNNREFQAALSELHKDLLNEI